MFHSRIKLPGALEIQTQYLRLPHLNPIPYFFLGQPSPTLAISRWQCASTSDFSHVAAEKGVIAAAGLVGDVTCHQLHSGYLWVILGCVCQLYGFIWIAGCYRVSMGSRLSESSTVTADDYDDDPLAPHLRKHHGNAAAYQDISTPRIIYRFLHSYQFTLW